MKKIVLLLAGLLAFTNLALNAQEVKRNRDIQIPPAYFNYQAALRDAGGNVLANEEVEITIEILEDAADGTVVYTQTETLTTTEQGLINLQVGNGSDLEGINWDNHHHFIRLTVDGTEMGASELLTVPYAMYSDMARFADQASVANIAEDATNAVYADTSVYAQNVQWNVSGNTAYALQDRVGIGVQSAAVAQLEISRNTTDVNSQIYVRQSGAGDAAIGLSTGINTYSIGIDHSDENKLKISSTYGPSEGEESITITTDDKVGIGTSEPTAQLQVEGGMKVGENGVEIGDIIEVTGTTSDSNFWISIDWPAGYTKDNSRILSAEIQKDEAVNGYKSLGYAIDGVNGTVYVSLSTNIWLYYPDDASMKGRPFRVTLMRVQ